VGDLLSPIHLIIVLGIALLVFGPKRLPELGAGLGRSLREFREATSGVSDALHPVRTALSAPVTPALSSGADPRTATQPASVAAQRGTDAGGTSQSGPSASAV